MLNRDKTIEGFEEFIEYNLGNKFKNLKYCRTYLIPPTLCPNLTLFVLKYANL